MADHDIRVTVRPGGGVCLYCTGERPGYVYLADSERPRWERCRDCSGTGLIRCACCGYRPEDVAEMCTVTRERVVSDCDDTGSEATVCAMGLCMAQEVYEAHQMQSLITGYWALGHSNPQHLARAKVREERQKALRMEVENRG